MRAFALLLLILPLLTGCESVQKSMKDISDSFDFDKERAKSQDSALVNGLASRTDQARAYKYLAFIYCVTERVPQCRQEFSNAITAEPKFTLTAAEAGHPTWGPVYRSVRGR